jgi:hypothetical protein
MIGCDSKPKIPPVTLETLDMVYVTNDSILWNAHVKNQTKDRTITALVWKIQIYDTLRRAQVDELYFTQDTLYPSDKPLMIAPGESKYIGSVLTNYNHDKYVLLSHYEVKVSLDSFKSK